MKKIINLIKNSPLYGRTIVILMIFAIIIKLIVIISTYWTIFWSENIITTTNYYFSFMFSDVFILLIILWLFTINYNIWNKKIRIINDIIMICILALFLIDIFTIYFFQSRLSINELSNFMINWSAWNSWYKKIIILLILSVIIIWMIIFTKIQKTSIKKVEIKKLTTVFFFVLACSYFLFSILIKPNYIDNIFSINIKNNELIWNKIDEIEEAGDREINEYKDIFTQTQWDGKDLNIILIFAESLSAIDSKNLWWNDNLPYFDEIQKNGITYTNFISNWVTSDSAHISTLMWIIPITNLWLQDSPYVWYNTYTQSLPIFLNQQWYNTTFISSVSLDFLNQKAFLSWLWFQKIIWEEAFKDKNKYSFDAAPDWDLYSFALQEIKTQTGKFFIWLQTISFHKVYDTPYWNTQESALKYADESLYNFYKWLEDINFFDSWILIIVWDHRKMNPAEKWELELFGENRYTRTIATVVWSWINKNTINNNIIQHTDIYDSIKKLIWNWKITINKFHNNIFTWKANRERWITSSPYYANKYTITLTWNKSFTFNNLSNLKLNNQEIYDFFSSYIKFELTNSSNDEWKEETILIWHKWAPNDAPENSIESFLTAKNQGAQWIELDISYTNDKKNIVAHWEYLYATNCNNKKIWNYTLDRINENCKYKNWESIKTLQETLEILDWLFDYYFIEIKVYESNAKEQTLDAIETIRSLNMQKKVILISYNDTARYILWAQTDIISWRDTFDTWDIELLKNSNYKYIWLPYESFSKEIANEISNQWKIPFTYTINNTWDFKKIKDMWINIIMTNNIPLLKDFNE